MFSDEGPKPPHIFTSAIIGYLDLNCLDSRNFPIRPNLPTLLHNAPRHIEASLDILRILFQALTSTAYGESSFVRCRWNSNTCPTCCRDPQPFLVCQRSDRNIFNILWQYHYTQPKSFDWNLRMIVVVVAIWTLIGTPLGPILPCAVNWI